MEPKPLPPYPMPSKLDVDDIRGIFDLWLSHQASKGNPKTPIQREAILMQWAAHGPHAFREALLASIANNWKNLYAPIAGTNPSSPRASVKPETPRHTLGIKDPGMGQVFKFRLNKEKQS